METRTAKSVDTKDRTLYGYAAVFNATTQIGDFTEQIAPNAFVFDADILALADHDSSAVLGRTRSKTLKLSQDAKGLFFELALPNTQAGGDLLELARRGDLGGMSFGFTVLEDAWQGNIRTLKKVQLHEISVIQAVPAYPQTSVSLRARQASQSVKMRYFYWLTTV